LCLRGQSTVEGVERRKVISVRKLYRYIGPEEVAKLGAADSPRAEDAMRNDKHAMTSDKREDPADAVG
jgi:hypothetical protein